MAMNFRRPSHVRIDLNKPYPEIKHPEDAILCVLRSCFCGSELRCGSIGIMAAKCARLFGVGRVIVIGHLDYLLEFEISVLISLLASRSHKSKN